MTNSASIQSLASDEHYMNAFGYEIYVKSFYGGERGTVLCLHGGPGVAHDYLLPLARLGHAGFKVVFYDQVGAGRSSRPPAPGPYNVDHYVRELEAVRASVADRPVHLFGSSWGGMLAMAYALNYPQEVLSIANCSGPASVPLYLEHVRHLKNSLDEDEARLLSESELRTGDNVARYEKALAHVQRLHSCRLDVLPQEMARAPKPGPALEYMWGNEYFDVTGSLRTFDITQRLPRLHCPTLLMCGRHDNVAPPVMAEIAMRVSGSRFVIFEESSHLPMWEEPEAFYGVLLDFLSNPIFQRHKE